MAFSIEESFQVSAPPERVWAYLIDPERVVECLPGAELIDAPAERTFRGRMKVSVGPVTIAYEGTAEFARVDEEARRVRIEARGQEATGPGSARMTMESTVAAGPDGGSEVRVEATVDVAGKIVQFGRGMIRTVSGEIFRQFSECARSTLETAPSAERTAVAAGGPSSSEVDGDSGKEPLRPLRLLFSALWNGLRRLFD